MRWFSKLLPLLAGLAFALPTAAQDVRLTTLDVRDTGAGLASGPFRVAGRAAPTKALVSGSVHIWATVTPVLGSPVLIDEAPVQAPALGAALTTDLPTEVALRSVFPNPLAGQARIPYDLPEAAVVRLVVYDALGRQVAVLADGEAPAGRHTASLDAAGLAPGVYHVRLTADAFVGATRFTVVR